MKAKIIQRSYLFFLLLLPFVHFSNTVDPVLIPRQIYLALFVLLLAIGFYQRKDVPNFPIKNPLFLTFGVYLLLMVISSSVNGFTSESYYVVSKQLLLFSFLLATVYALCNDFIDEHLIIKACTGAGAIALAGAYYQWLLAGDFWARATTIKSFFANKNLLSSFIFLCLPFFIMGLKQPKKWRWLALSCIIGSLPLLLWLGTRSVFLALGIFGTVALIQIVGNRFGIQKKMLMLGFLVFTVISIAALLALRPNPTGTSVKPLKGAEAYLERIVNTKTLSSRTKFWDNSVAMWKEKPVFGVGTGNWQVEFPKYGLNQFMEKSIRNGWETVQRPHNDFLNLLCENGILGLLAYLLVFTVIFYQLVFLIRHADQKRLWTYMLLLGAISGYLVISFFDFPMERIEHQILLMLLFAITTDQYHKLQKKTPVTGIEFSVLKFGVVAIGVYALVVGVYRFKGETETVKIYQAKSAELWDKSLLHAKNAENYFYRIDPTSMPIDWYKGTASFNIQDINQSVVAFESAYAQAPYQIQVIYSLATAYENHGEREKAIALYRKALEISSTFDEARLNLAAVYYNQKQYELAFQVIDKIGIANANKRYMQYLVPILQKKINLILTKNNDPELYKKIAEKITFSRQIYNLYAASKRMNISFESIVLSMKHKDIEL